MLSILSILIGWCTLHLLVTGDISTSWWAVRCLCSDSPMPTTECLQGTPSVGLSSSWDGPVYSAATCPATVWSQFKLYSKESNNKRNKTHVRAKTGGELLSSESHATANVSLLPKVTRCSFKDPMKRMSECHLLPWIYVFPVKTIS